MEKQSYYLILLLIALVVCIGVFLFQFNNNVLTFIIINETEVHENGSFSGMLMDAYSYGVANQTISLHKPGHDNGTMDVVTNENGEFKIENAEYISGAGKDNCYRDFTFAGNGKYQACTYEGNVTVIHN